jgi:hypothetical protein
MTAAIEDGEWLADADAANGSRQCNPPGEYICDVQSLDRPIILGDAYP